MSTHTDDLTDRQDELRVTGSAPVSEWSVVTIPSIQESTGSRERVAGLLRPRPGQTRSLLSLALACVLLGAFVGAFAGGVWGVLHPPQSSASADMVVESNVSLTGDMQVFDVTDREVATQQALLSSPAVAAAASARSGLDLPTAAVTSAQNSNMLVVSTTRPTPAQARRAVDAYLSAYFAMVSKKQRSQLEGGLSSAQQSSAAATAQLAQLDTALSAVSVNDRNTLLSIQSSERLALTQQVEDAAETQRRIQSSLASLPVNVEAVDGSTSVTPTGLSPVSWVVLGFLAGGAVGVIVVMRIAERRRARPAP